MSRQQNVSDADAVAIARVRDTWLKAIDADDLDGLLESLTDDAQVYPPHEAANWKKWECPVAPSTNRTVQDAVRDERR